MKIGDVVILKSGGPRMTVEEMKNKKVKCRWFDNNNYEAIHDEFVEEALKASEKQE